MKKFLICLTLLFLTVCIAFADDPAVGLWKEIDRKGNATTVWHLYEEDGKLLGEVLAALGCPDDKAACACRETYEYFPKKGKVNKMSFIGTPFIFNLKRESSGQWRGGRVINPNSGRWYYCKVSFYKADGKKYKVDNLKLRFELGWSLGKSIWLIPASKADISAIKAINKKMKIPADYPKSTE